MGKTSPIVLLDNTVLSNFSAVQRPDLVRLAVGASASIVQEVLDELKEGVRRNAIPQVDWSWLPVVSMTDEEQSVYGMLLERLNKGEAACLAVAMVREGRVFTDDRDARKIAVEMQIPVSGTLGVLIRLIDLRRLAVEDADHLLDDMIAKGYFAPIRSLTEIL